MFNLFYFFLILSITFFIVSMNFMILDYILMMEYSTFSINSTMVVMTILLDWMSLLFMTPGAHWFS